jgi:hypothetical protein
MTHLLLCCAEKKRFAAAKEGKQKSYLIIKEYLKDKSIQINPKQIESTVKSKLSSAFQIKANLQNRISID